MDNVHVSVGAIIHDNKILLVKTRSSSGYWTLPGGKVEPGETLFEAVIREIYEETGLVVESYAHLSCRTRKLHYKTYFVNYFLCSPVCDVSQLRDINDEVFSISWFPLEDINSIEFSSLEDYNILSSICA
ncbi:NUDIX hydrolase [Paenibacillus pabuli]|uniref:NUDIX hydrolase n=1 Tax=Paenibacillus pabuli TaxID=1472 RepID=UPI003242216D